MEDVFQLIKKEVEDLHKFFQDWFSGEVAESEFKLVENALDEEFTIISPNAMVSDKSTTLNLIKNSYNTNKYIKIWTDDVRVRKLSEGLYLCQYKELQKNNSGETKRISSAIFSTNKLDYKVKWLYVHETWMS